MKKNSKFIKFIIKLWFLENIKLNNEEIAVEKNKKLYLINIKDYEILKEKNSNY